MDILVINGSPKGKYSITLQHVNYLQRKYKEHTFKILHAGQTIKALEKNFEVAVASIRAADAIIFSYPVYTFLAPSQLHRFIELMKESRVDLSDKLVTQITTSKHFYDTTAHRYVEENMLDMGARLVRGLSADMEDLLSQRGREEAEKFFEMFLWSAENGVFIMPQKSSKEYSPVLATNTDQTDKADKFDVVLITDCKDTESSLGKMIDRFIGVLPNKVRVINIGEYPLAGGCLGCFRCAVTGKCVYKDGFDEFLRNDIQRADATVYAFEIKDHSMGARFKMYDDRNFCNGHRTVTVGMPVGYLISGAYSGEDNLKTVIEGRSQVGQNFLAGVATDEEAPNAQIDELAKKLMYCLEHKHTEPQNFLGVGGRKIFRDLIYQMRGMMKADHKFYKKHGFYSDFPQKHKGQALKMYLVGALLSSEKILSKIGNKMNDGMLMPYNKLFEKMEREEKRVENRARKGKK